MKRVVTLLITLLIWGSAMATGQDADVIYIDGVRWWLMGRPIGFDSALHASVLANLPNDYCESTDNWDGFKAYWSVQNDCLVLDSIQYLDEECEDAWLPDSVMQRIFKDHYVKGRIIADWVDHTLRLAQGKCIYYEHMGFFRHYDTEMLVHIEKGKVVNKELFHNRLAKKGFPSENSEQQLENIRHRLLPIVEKYSELDSIDKIYFSIRGLDIDSTGHLNSIETVELHLGRWYKDSDSVLAPIQRQMEQEIRAALMNIPEWEVWYINGKYINFTGGWAFPLIFRERND